MLYQRTKTRFNFYVDRVIDWTDRVSTESDKIRHPLLSNNIKSAAKNVGDYGRLLTNFPRLDAFKVTGFQGSIIFVRNNDPGTVTLMRVLFPDGYQMTPMGRVALWQLPTQAETWLNQTDLVICKISRKSPWSLKALYTFDNPIKIRQALTLDRSVEELLISRGNRDLRRSIRKVQGANVTFKFSRSQEDFDYFYHRMYLPTIKNRFGEAAIVTSYEGLMRYGLKPGGLLLMLWNDQVVDGCLVHIWQQRCFLSVGGVLDGNLDLNKQGVSTMFYYCAVQWAISQGAKEINFGSTNAWQSDGVFYTKQRWGTKVVDNLLEHNKLLFLVNHLSAEWRAHLNRIGFLTQRINKYLRVYLENLDQPYSAPDIEVKRYQALKSGLDGIQIVGVEGNRDFIG